MPNLIVYPDTPSFVDGAADLLVDLATKAIAERGRFTIALSGGNTPRPIYARLAAAEYSDRIEWRKVHVFFGDERCVPPDDTRSNYRMAREALLDQVPLPPEQVHRIQGEIDPAQAALRYEQELRELFRTSMFPAFDLIYLGLGKAEPLWRVLEGPYQPDVLPAQLIEPVSGQVHWLMDAAAAAKVDDHTEQLASL
jgi:6-phosphogluconolactonase